MLAVLLFAAAPPAATPREWLALVHNLADDERRHGAVTALRRLGEEAVPFLRREARRPGIDVDARLALNVVTSEIHARHWGLVRAMGPGAALKSIQFRWMHSFRPAGFSHDGKAVVAAWAPLVFDLADGKQSGAAPGPGRERDAHAVISVSRDGRRALLGRSDRPNFRLVALPGLEPTREFRGHPEGVLALALSPDGSAAAVAGVDGAVIIWDARTGKQRRTLQGPGADVASRLAFSPGGEEVYLSSAGGLRVHDTASGKRLRTLPTGGHASSIATLPGGRLLVGMSTGDALVLRASDGKELLRLRHGKTLYAAAASPEGRRAATMGAHSLGVKVWCLGTGRVLETLEGHVAGPVAACFSPDGTRLLTGDSVSALRLWRVGRCGRTGEP